MIEIECLTVLEVGKDSFRIEKEQISHQKNIF